MTENGDSNRQILRQAMEFSGHGLTLAILFAAGVWGGMELDRRFGTDPLFVFLGAIFSMAFGLYWLLLQLKRMEQRDE